MYIYIYILLLLNDLVYVIIIMLCLNTLCRWPTLTVAFTFSSPATIRCFPKYKIFRKLVGIIYTIISTLF